MNYWKCKKDDLLELIDMRGIIIEDEDKDNRKFVINLLKLDDLDRGGTNKTLILNDENEIVELDSNLSELRVDKEEKPNELVPKTQVDKNDPYRGIRMMRAIFRHREDGEPGYVQLGSNGRQFYIPKDVEVVLPAYLKPVIDTAVMTKLESITNARGDIEQRKTNMHRIAWEFRGYVN